MSQPIYTIGHSTRTLDELVALLRAFDVSVLADIRTIPRSRHNPQFNSDALRSSLRARSIRYAHLAALGGLRKTHKDSPNSGWRNASFRGFADYMLTPDFETGLEALRVLTEQGTVALMCAEAVPWRCHRSLVADALTARGIQVEHIIGASRSTPHHLTPFAKVEGSRVRYPAETVETSRLLTRAPFHLEATVRVLQRRPANPVEVWDQNRYLRVLESADGLALLEVENCGTIDRPDVRLSIRSGNATAVTRAEFEQTIRKVLGLDVDSNALQRLADVEPALRPATLALRGMRPPRFAGFFEAFANVVPFQQLSLDAGLAIVGRLVERFGKSLEHDGRRFHAFPEAEAVAEVGLAPLRECGLSARKAESLRAIARTIASRELCEGEVSKLSTGDALRRLRELPGIGPWSAALVLLRGLGRLDVFPPGDVGAAHRLAALMPLRPRASVEHEAERFGDVQGYLYFCGLGNSLLAGGLIHAAPRVPRRPPRGAPRLKRPAARPT